MTECCVVGESGNVYVYVYRDRSRSLSLYLSLYGRLGCGRLTVSSISPSVLYDVLSFFSLVLFSLL